MTRRALTFYLAMQASIFVTPAFAPPEEDLSVHVFSMIADGLDHLIVDTDPRYRLNLKFDDEALDRQVAKELPIYLTR